MFIETGYGLVSDNGKSRGAHRVAWERANGKIPAGLSVLHACDNRLCVNVEHLFLGTQADNMADKIAKGRHAFGARTRTNKLTDGDIPVIRARLALGETLSAIARDYDVQYGAIGDIRDGVTWRHVPVHNSNHSPAPVAATRSIPATVLPVNASPDGVP